MKPAHLMKTENNRNENHAKKKKKKIKARIYKPSENILCFELLKSRKL